MGGPYLDPLEQARTWTDWTPDPTHRLTLLPGLHHLDVVARSSVNGARRLVEQGRPTSVGLRVDASWGADTEAVTPTTLQGSTGVA